MKKMKSGMIYKQGEIVLIPYPFSDLSNIKQRPVLILSNNKYNFMTEDIVVCGITSNIKDSEYSVLLDNKDLLDCSLPIRSRIKADKLFTLKSSLIKKNLGKVNNKILERVNKEILKLFYRS